MNGPAFNLKTLRDLIDKGQPVVIDQNGTVRPPGDPSIASIPDKNKTTLKPSRWFAEVMDRE
jgi:hypothetical protein